MSVSGMYSISPYDDRKTLKVDGWVSLSPIKSKIELPEYSIGEVKFIWKYSAT